MTLISSVSLGRTIEEIRPGEKLVIDEKVEDQKLLLYLGLTNDTNPLYLQNDYANKTPYEKPIVPTALLTGIVTSAISKYLPGPGSMIKSQSFEFKNPAYHSQKLTFMFEVVDVILAENIVVLNIKGSNDAEKEVLQGTVKVAPPYEV